MRLLALALLGVVAVISPVAGILGVSQERDGFKLLLGKSQDELVVLGRLAYPDEAAEHNHQCHRLAAKLATQRFGVLFALAGGAANEAIEGLALLSFGRNPFDAANRAESLGDLAANWRGIKDALAGR